MRAYSITLTRPDGSLYVPPSLQGAGLQGSWSSFATNNNYVSGALNIECDIPIFTQATPMGRAWVRIWGISLQEIATASQLSGFGFKMLAGMSAGFPLANPNQYGPVLQGQVYQALGNWQGTDQTLDLFVYPNIGTIDQPKNLTLNWPANTPMAQAIQQMLSAAYPGFTINVNISPNLVQAVDDKGPYPSLEAFAQWVREKSIAIIGGSTYLGVAIVVTGNTVSVFDNGVSPSSGTTPKAIAFTDMIGQPVWLDFPLISFKTVMRSDIQVGDYVNLPPNISTATPGSMIGVKIPGSQTPARDNFAVAGTYQIQVVRHLGNFRQPDADSWVTAFNAYPVTLPNGQQ